MVVSGSGRRSGRQGSCRSALAGRSRAARGRESGPAQGLLYKARVWPARRLCKGRVKTRWRIDAVAKWVGGRARPCRHSSACDRRRVACNTGRAGPVRLPGEVKAAVEAAAETEIEAAVETASETTTVAVEMAVERALRLRLNARGPRWVKDQRLWRAGAARCWRIRRGRATRHFAARGASRTAAASAPGGRHRAQPPRHGPRQAQPQTGAGQRMAQGLRQQRPGGVHGAAGHQQGGQGGLQHGLQPVLQPPSQSVTRKVTQAAR